MAQQFAAKQFFDETFIRVFMRVDDVVANGGDCVMTASADDAAGLNVVVKWASSDLTPAQRTACHEAAKRFAKCGTPDALYA